MSEKQTKAWRKAFPNFGQTLSPVHNSIKMMKMHCQIRQNICSLERGRQKEVRQIIPDMVLKCLKSQVKALGSLKTLFER
jgi:hypothetical protein